MLDLLFFDSCLVILPQFSYVAFSESYKIESVPLTSDDLPLVLLNRFSWNPKLLCKCRLPLAILVPLFVILHDPAYLLHGPLALLSPLPMMGQLWNLLLLLFLVRKELSEFNS